MCNTKAVSEAEDVSIYDAKEQKKQNSDRLICRAKRLLMECLSFTEEQAYSYIKHHAMDMRVTKEQVAQAVLTTYGGTEVKRKKD